MKPSSSASKMSLPAKNTACGNSCATSRQSLRSLRVQIPQPKLVVTFGNRDKCQFGAVRRKAKEIGIIGDQGKVLLFGRRDRESNSPEFPSRRAKVNDSSDRYECEISGPQQLEDIRREKTYLERLIGET